MTKKKKVLIILSSIILLIIFFPVAYLSPFKGQVIGTGTKEPIEGAVVLVVYWKEVPTIVAGSNTYPADAQETLTDKHGEFSIPWKLAWFGKAKWWPEANVNIFKPGYGAFPRHKRATAVGVNKSWPPPKKYIVYEIPKLKTISERRSNLPRSFSEIPYEKRKLFFKLINEEYMSLGFSPRSKN